MSKFWTVVTGIAVLGVILLATTVRASAISFTDLETECRYDRGEEVTVGLNEDESLTFSGHFPVKNADNDLNYDYSQSSDRIVLNVKSSRVEEPLSFWNDCLGSVVYEAHTRPLEPGDYVVKVKHNGEVVDERVIGIQ